MKKTLLFLVVCFVQFSGHAQGPNYAWSGHIGGTGNDLIRGLHTDASGNIYTTGSFNGAADIDPSLSTLSVTGNGGIDLFVNKLNPNGALDWAIQIGGSGTDSGFDVRVDNSGNTYTTGYFQNTVDFDPGAGTINLTAGGTYGVFIQKLTTGGTLSWVSGFTGPGSALARGVDIDASGVYVIGNFEGTIDFDPGPGINNLTATTPQDVFIAKLDLNGDLLWVHQFGNGSGANLGYALVTDGSNIYATGGFESVVDFDPGAGTQELTSNGQRDIFVLKLTSNGDFVWVKGVGATQNDLGTQMDVDAAGNVVVTGYFQQTADFDPGAGTASLASNGSTDIFVLKLSASGNYQWAHSFGDADQDGGWGITTDVSGDVYVTGEFSGTVDFDPGAGTTSLLSVQGDDQFMQRFTTNGDLVWVTQAGGPEAEKGGEITVDQDNSIVTVGSFRGTVDFNPSSTGTNNQTSFGLVDGFIQKFTQCIPTAGTDVINACESYTWIDGNTYTTSNNSATFTLTNAAGCDSTVTLDLTINTAPSSAVNQVDITLTADASGVSYQWVDCDNNFAVISGATGQTFTPTVNGNYAVIVSENGCSDTSICYAIAEVGLEENGVFRAEIYPNPTNDVLTVELEQGIGIVDFRMISAEGKLVRRTVLEESHTTLNVAGIEPGIYTVQLRTENSISQRKIIVH